jgi:hypothetical protein
MLITDISIGSIYKPPTVRINNSYIRLKTEETWFLRSKIPSLVGVKITTIKIHNIYKEDIQAICILPRILPSFCKGIVLTINNKYPLIWITKDRDNEIILSEELQQYLKQ